MNLIAYTVSILSLFAVFYFYLRYKNERKLRIFLFERTVKQSSEVESFLREKEKQYQDIYDTANSVIIRWNPDFKIQSINPFAEEFFSVKKDEVAGKDLVLHLFGIPESEANYLKSKLWNIFHNPDFNVRQEYEVYLKNSDRRTLSWSNRILKNDFGYPYEVLSIGNDITNRKIAEENLTKSYERILDLYNNAPCGYHSLDENDNIISMNNTEISWFGYSKEELMNEFHYLDLLTESGKEVYLRAKERLIDEKTITGIELECRRKDNSTFFVSLNSSLTLDTEGKYLISKSTVFEITDRKFAENKLNLYSKKIEQQNRRLQKAVEVAKEANRTKSVFFSKITHELRTPLHAVIGFSQILSKDPNLPEHLSGYTNSLYENGVHLLGMINDILDISKIEMGKITEIREPFSLQMLWDHLFSMFSYRFLEKGLTFSLEKPNSIPTHFYFADLQKIRQILVNLLGNALKFTKQGKVQLEILVQTNAETSFDLVEFRVLDTGIGIQKDQLTKIFEAFQQTEEGRSYKEGTGLGLTISSQLVEFLGGTIYVESIFGKGSTFSFTLPMERFASGSLVEGKVWSGKTSTEELIVTKRDLVSEETLTQDFVLSLPQESRDQVLHWIKIQNWAELESYLQVNPESNEGKSILLKKIHDKRYKFLLELLTTSSRLQQS